MQRSEQLIPLSHDHHHGLVFCRRIVERLNREEEPAHIVRYVLDFWEEHLAPHFLEEETLWFPLLSEECAERIQALDEHLRIQGLIQKLVICPYDSVVCLRQLADLLREHIHFEERVLFPLIERSVPDEVLRKVGASR